MKTSVIARAAAVALAVLALSACSAINPITTKKEYQASDGVNIEIGDAGEALNLLVVTTAKDAPAVLTGSIHNAGSDSLEVRVSIDGTNVTTVDVPAAGTVQLGTSDGQTLVQGTATAAPGGLATVALGTDVDGALTVDVPVVDGTIPPYQDIVDSIPALPSPSPSVDPADASASPSPSPSA